MTQPVGTQTDEAGSSRANPDALMAEVLRPRLGRMLAISTVFHAALITLTSLTFLGLCWKHKTFHPKWAIKQIQKEEAEKEALAEQAKAAAELKKKAATKKKAGGMPDDAAPTKGGASPTPAEGKATEKSSSIEKELKATSKERPAGSSVGLNELDLK